MADPDEEQVALLDAPELIQGDQGRRVVHGLGYFFLT